MCFYWCWRHAILKTNSYFWRCRWCVHCPLPNRCSLLSSSLDMVSAMSDQPHMKILASHHSNAPLWRYSKFSIMFFPLGCGMPNVLHLSVHIHITNQATNKQQTNTGYLNTYIHTRSKEFKFNVIFKIIVISLHSYTCSVAVCKPLN